MVQGFNAPNPYSFPMKGGFPLLWQQTIKMTQAKGVACGIFYKEHHE